MKATMLLLTALLGLNLSASDLCGAASQEICLESAAQFNIRNDDGLEAGTTIVLAVPGIDITGSSSVDGIAEEPYRLKVTGSAVDDKGGTWLEPLALDVDERGATAIAFRLTGNTVLFDPSIVLSGIKVCQYVADGPGTVSIDFAIWGNFQKRKRIDLVSYKQHKMESAFQTCSQYAGNAPVFRDGQKLHILNPHNESLILETHDGRITMAAGQSMVLEGPFPNLASMNASLPVAMVAFGEDDDINLTPLNNSNGQNWMLPHIARDGSLWRNRWVFISPERNTLRWKRGAAESSRFFDTGFHELELDADGGAPHAILDASSPINGFFEFARPEVGGSSWIPARPPGSGSSTLYLPHVAADTNRFWTGYSLANPNSEAVTITMTAYSLNGAMTAQESFVLDSGANEIGLIGVDRFTHVSDVSWVRIESDAAIEGLCLLGEHGLSAFSGYLLPGVTSQRLLFPMTLGGEYWTGVAAVNAGDTPVDALFTWRDAEGKTLGVQSERLEPGQKFLTVVPEGAKYAVLEGENLIGFCAVGAEGKIGSYAGFDRSR